MSEGSEIYGYPSLEQKLMGYAPSLDPTPKVVGYAPTLPPKPQPFWIYPNPSLRAGIVVISPPIPKIF